MSQADLKALQNPLLALLLVLLAGAAAVYYSDRMKTVARQQLAQQQTLLKEARNRLQKSGDEKDIIVRYLDSFRQLERAGFIGEEQRINWLDGLRLANQQVDLFGVMRELVRQRYPRAIYPEHPRALDVDRERGSRTSQYPGGGGFTAETYNVAYARAMLQAALTL